MRITKKSEQEVLAEQARFKTIPAGDYEFSVESAIDAVSKTSGAEMIKLTLTLYMPDGRERKVWDYLVDAMGYKLRHFCAACGLIDKYEQGDLTARDCVGAHAMCKIKVVPPKGEYSEKNEVEDYMPMSIPKERERKQVIAKPATENAGSGAPYAPLTEDQIPF